MDPVNTPTPGETRLEDILARLADLPQIIRQERASVLSTDFAAKNVALSVGLLTAALKSLTTNRSVVQGFSSAGVYAVDSSLFDSLEVVLGHPCRYEVFETLARLHYADPEGYLSLGEVKEASPTFLLTELNALRVGGVIDGTSQSGTWEFRLAEKGRKLANCAVIKEHLLGPSAAPLASEL